MCSLERALHIEMASRNFILRMTSLPRQFLKIAHVYRDKYALISTSRTSDFSSINGFACRFYSNQENIETLPVVDFDYVKRATSQSEVMIIDVREPDEIKEHGKIPNSVNIPLGSISATLALSEKDFQQVVNRSKPKENTEIIFYCMIGKRSGKAQQSALNLGFKNAKNYVGSWTDWVTKTQ